VIGEAESARRFEVALVRVVLLFESDIGRPATEEEKAQLRDKLARRFAETSTVH
jgi:hypothetical protein